ncbi:radical SAM protein [candidate division KSB1 bacterium]|nr:radical SAM protein [candidate division KSB1 bacterium]
MRNPSQAFSFIRTLGWLARAAHRRSTWKRRDVTVPPIIIFSVTNKCNLHCKGCYAQSFHSATEDELSAQKLREITEEAEQLGVSFFVLAGGEPFMRPEIMDIMNAYPQIIFLVFTNGLLIDDALIRQFKAQRNLVPLISLEGTAEDTDDRRGVGTFAFLENVMQIMRTENIFFGTSLTLTRDNFPTILERAYIKNMVDAGCKFFLFLEYTPTAEGTENWTLTIDQRNRVSGFMDAFRNEYPALFIAVPWDEDDVGGCLSAARGFVHINARGDIEPCPFAPFSDTNVRDASLKDALQSEFMEKIRQIPELSRETGGGCILWKERELVQSLLKEVG